MTDTHFSGNKSEDTMSNRARLVGLTVLGAIVTGQLAPLAHAQCPAWVTQPISGLLGINGPVDDQLVWDPDGAGPLSPVLVAAGQFSIAGTVPVNSIAAWNGTTWAPLGDGVMNGSVAALAEYNGDLIAAGTFDTAGGLPASHIARWDGSAWHAMESGSPLESTNDFINALAVYNGHLYAGGQFSSAGNLLASRIARWDGSAWSAVEDPSLFNGVTGGNVVSLGTYAGKLIVGGSFTSAGGNTAASRVAAWNGTSWETLGSGVDNTVSALGEYNGVLIVGGRFVTATNPDGAPVPTVTANRIASWNGTEWSALSTGVSTSIGVAVINDLAVYNGELVAIGNFRNAGTLPANTANRIARWNGTAWNTLGTGFSFLGDSVAVFGGSLYASGGFSQAGGIGVANFARWDGAAWNTVGTSGFNESLSAFGAFNGELISGGPFTRNGTTTINRVARLSGGTWQPLGSGLNNTPLAFANFGSSLIAGGFFTDAGGTTVSNIAAWDGSAWTDLDGGLNSAVTTLGNYAGELIAGGFFTAAGVTPAESLARWNGTTWQPLAGGVGGGVSALATYGGTLVVGGSFSDVDASLLPANSIATWNGTAWQTLGTGMVLSDGVDDSQGSVTALKVFGGDLIAAGTFNVAGGTPVKNVARWNGMAWSAMGDGLGDPDAFDSVSALEIYNGELYATGIFAVSGADDVVVLARWNAGTSDWVPVTTPGVGGGAGSALFAHAGELHMGGTFSSVDNAVAVNWARLASSPVVALPPANQSVAELSTLNLSAQVNGAPTLTYQWRRNGSPISNGLAGASVGGGTVSGATSATLAISGVRLSDAGSYAVTVTNTCGMTLSPVATVTVFCRADFDRDGMVAVGDIFAFLNAWFASCDGTNAGAPCFGQNADVDNTGTVAVEDIFVFLNVWFSGC